MSERRRDDPRMQAHPTSPRAGYDWPEPARWRRIQFPAATVVGVLVVLAAIGAVLVLGALAGAVLGVEMGPVPA